MNKRNCPLCGSSHCKNIPIDEPTAKVGDNVICLQCGLIYHNPVMSQQEMIHYYEQEFSCEYHESKDMQQELAEDRFTFLKCKINSDIGLISPVLEVGCAYGDFLAKLASEGFHVEGIEPSRRLANVANRDRQVKVNNQSYEDTPLKEGHYGMVASFHSLEHFYDPLAVLRRMWRELKEGGVLYVVVPTLADSQLALVFKAIHPTTFVHETLTLMLNKAGFEVKENFENGYNLMVIACKVDESEGVLPDVDVIYSRATSYLNKRSRIIENIISKLDLLKGASRIAIYGAGHNTIDLNEVFALSQLNVVGIYDADPQKQGKQLLDVEIKPPKELQEFSGNAVIISSYKFQEEIVGQLKYLEDRGVDLITLYDKD